MIVATGSAAPSASMRLLLQAAVLPGPPARSAWDRWLASVDFERLEPGATELLSLVSRNVPWHDQDAEGSISRRVTGVHHQTWAKNRVAWAKVTPLIDELASTVGPPLVMGAPALLPAYCDDWGARPFGRLDLALQVSAAGTAREVLASTGWVVDRVTRLSVARTEAGLVAHWRVPHPDGSWLTVRWHVLRGVHARVVDEQLLGAAQPATVGLSTVTLLHPADALIERLWHGPREDQPVWIADVVQLARRVAVEAAPAEEGRGLVRFAGRAHRLGIGRPLRQQLEFVRAMVPDPLVGHAIDALADGRPTSVSALWAVAGPADGAGRALAGHCAGQGLRRGVASLLRAQITARHLRSQPPVSAPRK